LAGCSETRTVGAQSVRALWNTYVGIHVCRTGVQFSSTSCAVNKPLVVESDVNARGSESVIFRGIFCLMFNCSLQSEMLARPDRCAKDDIVDESSKTEPKIKAY